MGKLYVYSTKTLMYPRTIHMPEGDVNYMPWFKIGMTEQDLVEVRVKQQDGTSNPEILQIQKIFNDQNYFDLEPYDISAYEAEQHIHSYFRDKGREVRLDASREWFECTIEEIREAIQHIIDPEAHKLILNLMPHQILAYTFLIDRFGKGAVQVLLNHKPRSGKTFIIYYYLLKHKPSNVLLFTNYPVLNNQWINDAKKIKGLDYDFINMSNGEIDEIVLHNETPNFVFCSLQDGKGGEEIFGKKKFDLLKNIKWDLVIIDECHKGKETSKTDVLLDKIKFKKLIGLSATPTKNLIRGTFEKENIHVYNLVDEAKFKKEYPDIYKLPDISYWMYNVPESVRKELKFYSEEEQFTWNKFLSVKDGRLVYKNDLRIFFMWIAGYYGGGINAPFKKFDANSVLLFVQNNECQSLLLDLLNEIPFYRENYNIHFTNSEISGDSSKLLEKTKTTYIPRDGKKCIVIANRQLTTGITLKYCDMVMFMNDWESIDEYIQASFRCQSPMLGKTTCQVIDFTPYRTFTILNRYIENNTIFNGKSLDSNRAEFLNSVSLFESSDNGFKSIDLQSFKERVVDSMDISSKNFFGSYLINKDIVEKDCEWLVDRLGHIESGDGPSETKERLDDNGIEKGKSKETSGEKKDKKESEESDKKLLWALENIEYFLGKTPLLSICCDYKIDNLDDCLDYIHSDSSREKSFIEFLSLDGQLNIDFATADLIYRNYINNELLNDRIITLNIKFRKLIYTENKSLRVINIEKVLGLIESYIKISKIEKEIHGEVFTRIETINELLDLLPIEMWRNPKLKYLDPCAGIGNFEMVILQRLMKGLEEWEPDVEKRYKYIMENMIYTCDIQPKNTFIYLQLFDPNNECKLNWYRGSFLDKGFDNKMKEWGVEKFDIGLGNPPFTQMIDMDFVSKSYDISDKVLFVHPSTWLLDEKNKQKKFIKVKDKIGKNLEKIVLFNGNEIFHIALFVPCVYTYINKNKKTDGIDCIDKLLNKIVHYNDIYEINKFSDVDIYPTLKEKILKKSKVDNLLNHKNVDNSQYYINLAQIRGNVSKYDDKYLTKEDFYTICPKDTKVIRDKTKHMFFSFDNYKKANNFLNYIKTDFVRFCLSIYKNNSQLDRGELESIPWIDFSKEWNNENLIKEFDLTKEEIEFIEEVIPRYYD